MYPRYDTSWVVLGVRTFSLVYFWYCSCLTEVGAHSGLEEELEDLDVVPFNKIRFKGSEGSRRWGTLDGVGIAS